MREATATQTLPRDNFWLRRDPDGYITCGGINLTTIRANLTEMFGGTSAGEYVTQTATANPIHATPHLQGKPKVKRAMSAAGRKAIALATKRRWAEARAKGKTLTGKTLTKAATA